MVGKETKRKKKKQQKKIEDGIVKRLAKNGLIDKDKVGGLIKEILEEEEKEEERPVLLFLLRLTPPLLTQTDWLFGSWSW